MAKSIASPITKEHIRLRLLEESDLPMTLKWRNQDHIRKWFIHSDLISPEKHREWFDAYLLRDNDYLFIIEETENLNKPVGQISLYNIDGDRKWAEYGRLMIGEADARGRGLAKEASRLLLQYAFKVLGMERVELEVFRDNEPAIAIYRSCGFREVSELEGLIKFVVEAILDDI